MIGEIVYVLCALASTACAVLLLRGYAHGGVRLLLWSGLCFVGLALNSALIFADMVLFASLDLSVWRTIPALLGLGTLLYGLIWETTA